MWFSDFLKQAHKLKSPKYIVTVKQGQHFLASNFKHTKGHRHTHSVVGSIVMHLIHHILITVPVCGKQSQRCRRGYGTTKTLTTVLALVLLFLWPQVNKPTGPPGEQTKAKWRRHWYAIRSTDSNHCCGAESGGGGNLKQLCKEGEGICGLREWDQLTCLTIQVRLA